MADPDPRTAGKGFERLRQAGIEVASGSSKKRRGVRMLGIFGDSSGRCRTLS